MIKKIGLITILIWNALWLTGQEIVASHDITVRATGSYEIIGKVKETHFIVVHNGGYHNVYAFDGNMKEKWDKRLDLEKKSFSLHGIVPAKDYFFTYYSFKEKGQVNLMLRKMDENLELIDSTTLKIFPRRGLTPEMEFVQSKDKSKSLFYSVLGNGHDYELLVVDNEEMKVIQEVTVSLKEFEQRDFLQTIVDNEGGVYFIFQKDNRKIKQAENMFQAVYFEAGNKSPKLFNLPMEGKLWYEVAFDFDNEHKKLLATGFYAADNNYEAEGIFYLNITPKEPNETFFLKFHPFNIEYLSLLYGKELKKNVGLSDVEIQQLLPRTDGGVMMIAEIYKEQIRMGTTTNNDRYYGRSYNNQQVDYFYNDILLFSFHPDGEVHWQEILQKKQYSQDDEGVYSSFFLFLNRAKIRFLYNDTIKKNDAVYEYVVSGDGTSERNSLFTTEKSKLMLRMIDAVQISGNEILVPSERRGRIKLVKLTF